MKHELAHDGSNSSHTFSHTQERSLQLLLQKPGDSNAGWPYRRGSSHTFIPGQTVKSWFQLGFEHMFHLRNSGWSPPWPQGWRMERNRFSPHNVLTVITGSGMSAYGESGHTYTHTLTPKCLPRLVTRANWSLTSCSSQSSLRLCDMLKRSWIKVKKTSVLISFGLDIGCLIYDLKRVSYPSKNSEPYLIWRRMW